MVALANLAVTQSAAPSQAPQTDDGPYRRLGLTALAVTFVFLLAWAALAPLRSAVVTNGRLIAASDNQTVEHLDGGLIEEIRVHDGDAVQAGQVLLRLDPRPLQIQRDNIDGQRFEIEANLERLSAERRGLDALQFSSALVQRADSAFEREILATQQAVFDTRRDALSAEREMLAQRAEQANKQVAAIDAVVTTLRSRIALLDEDLAGLRKLSSDKLVAASQLREMQRRRSELVGEIAERDGEITSLTETAEQSRQRMELRRREHQREVAGELRDLQAKLISLEAAHRGVIEKLSRIEIRAPVSGKVKGFDIATTGVVVNAGDPIMEIVPSDTQYRIQARISPMDIDAMHPGMLAEIRLSAIDGSRHFPVIYADLDSVSADAFTNDYHDETYYKALFSMRDDALRILHDESARLVPGMPVSLYVVTGERTLLDYLTRPLQDLLARALNEA